MEVPSGQIFDKDDLELMRLLCEYRVVGWHATPVQFRSGIKSHVYTSLRNEFTDHPDLEWQLGKKVAQLIVANTLPEDKQPCLIGIYSGGNPLAQAAAMASSRERILAQTALGQVSLCHRAMRGDRKSYGTHNTWVEGEADISRHTYWYVDNVVTDAGTKLEARDRMIESFYPGDVMPSFILVDLQRGGLHNMDMWGFQRVVVGYQILDIVYAFVRLGLWSPERLFLLEQEIETGSAV